jgi:hypothetical protein
VYVDTNKLSQSATGLNISSTSDMRIGARAGNQNDSFFKGFISNVAVYNTNLTDSNVSTLYNNGQPQVTIFGSPQAWYKLDSTTITDYSGNGNTGTNNGTTQVTSNVYAGNIPVNGVSTTLPSTALQQSDLQFEQPFSNYSLNFDGTTLINTGTAIGNSLGVYNGSLSVSFWFKHNVENQWNMLFDMKPGAFNTAYGEFSVVTHYGSGTPKIFATVNSKGYYTDFAVSTAATQWNHLVFQLIYDSTAGNFDTKLYINGTDSGVTPSGTKPTTGQIDFSNGDTVIGGISTGQNYNGKIDETSIFNYALSEAQVLEIYNNGKPSNLSTFSGTAPINWWRLGENAYFDNNNVTLPNSITGAPNGVSSGTATSMLTADAPGTYANGVGTNLDIIDRVGEAPLSIANSQSYNIIPSDISPYVPQYVGKQIANNFSMTFDGVNDYIETNFSGLNGLPAMTLSIWAKTPDTSRYQYLFGNNSTGSDGIWLNQYSSLSGVNDVTIFYLGAGYVYFSNPNNNILDNTWFNFTVVFDASGSSNTDKVKIYVNGSQVTYIDGGIAFPSTILPTSPNTLKIGDGTRFTTYPKWEGNIDEVAIFDTALNAGQIYNDIYQPTATGTNQTADIANNPNLPNPVAWYRMGD